MSPVPTLIREQSGGRQAPVQPFPTTDVVFSQSIEMVVDWQMSSDVERKA
jgi:hypothetical protein